MLRPSLLLRTSLGTTIAVATALLALGPAPGVAAGAASPDPSVRTVHRAYGDGPVRQRSLQEVVRLRFDGRAGDRVTLVNRNIWHGNHCPPVTLAGRGPALKAMQELVPGARATARVRLSTVLAPMPLDGTPVTFTAATPGQWVLAPVTLDDGSYTLDATGWTVPGRWSGRASAVDELHCPVMGPIGCGEHSAGYVNARHPASGFFSVGYGGRNPWAVLLRVPSASTGSVDLALTPMG